MEWSREFYGVSHLGKFSLTKIWATVTHYSDKLAMLSLHYPGAIWRPVEMSFDTVDEAKREGEKHVSV